jgi:hypothetical protein
MYPEGIPVKLVLSLGALMALTLAGCSGSSSSMTGPDMSTPSLLNCGGGTNHNACTGSGGGGGQTSNNPNNPPTTAP